MSESLSAPLFTFADITMGQSPGADLCNTEGHGLPFLQGCAEFGARHPETLAFCFPPLRIARAGSVLISVRAPVGTMNYADQDYCIGRGLAAYKAKSGLANTVFLKHAVENGIRYLHRRSQGSTFAAVSSNDLRTVPIPVFSPQMQNKLAEIFNCIDATIERTEDMITKLQNIKEGLMHDLFTQGVLLDGKLRPPREQAPELYHKTPIGWIPREWTVQNFGLHISIIDPNPSHRYPDEVTEGVPICSTENFVDQDGFDLTRSKMVPEKSYTDQNLRCQFKPTDVVFARKGKIGLARRYGTEKKVFSHTVVILKPKSDAIDPKWLLWLARSYWFLGGIDRTMNSNSGVPTLGVDFISKVLIPIPSKPEQSRAAERLDHASSALAGLQNELQKLRFQKVGLVQELLSRKVGLHDDTHMLELANA